MIIIHEKSGQILGQRIKLANTFCSRLSGFMFRESIEPYDGLFLVRNNSVHNCFVRFSLDIVFINKDNEIVKIIRNFHPWRFSRIYFRARHTIEFSAGTISDSIVVGDKLIIDH
jgi:uncharacterized membrane protein (UPF0127 family)